MRTQEKIMYVCESCANNWPEGCGHFDRADVRVASDGRWLCYGCYEDGEPHDAPAWSTLPAATEYVPR